MIKINQKNLIRTFFDLVKIYSPSGKEDQVAQYLTQELKKLKLKYKIDQFGNLLSFLPGKGASILYLAHMDTVEPCKNIQPIIKNSIIQSAGKTILGADMKAGIAAILQTIEYFKKNKIQHSPIEIIFTREEETGLYGARALKKENLKSKKAILFDGTGPVGGIALKESAGNVIKIKLYGKSAHAGTTPGNGISAIKTAGKIISQLKFGHINLDTAFNIGKIKGGNAVNTVAGYTEMEGEIRSLDNQKAEKLTKKIIALIKKISKENKTKVKIEMEKVVPAYSIAKNSLLVKKIVQTMRSLKIKPYYYQDMGASEAGALNDFGIQAIDLSYGGREDHNLQENISIKDLVLMTKFLIKFAEKD